MILGKTKIKTLYVCRDVKGFYFIETKLII
jgi:hypothetical protein